MHETTKNAFFSICAFLRYALLRKDSIYTFLRYSLLRKDSRASLSCAAMFFPYGPVLPSFHSIQGQLWCLPCLFCRRSVPYTIVGAVICDAIPILSVAKLCCHASRRQVFCSHITFN